MKMNLKIVWRNWHYSPLLIIGKYTLWFTNGIIFGKTYNCADVCYYIGWLIIRKKTKFHRDFIKRVNNRTWSESKLWIIKYGR